MSKIGRRPIDLAGVLVEISEREIVYKGPKAQGTHVLPDCLYAELIDDNRLVIQSRDLQQDSMRLWGLHRALLSNKIIGAHLGFSRQLKIVGLGYKAVVQGSNVQFSLGYSHKIDFAIPQGIQIEVDKSGQLVTCKGTDKELVGLICSKIRALRVPEPYKGTGIQYVNEVIIRKAGKAKA